MPSSRQTAALYVEYVPRGRHRPPVPPKRRRRRRKNRGRGPLLLMTFFGAGAVAASALLPNEPHTVAYNPPAWHLDPVHTPAKKASTPPPTQIAAPSGAVQAAVQATPKVAPVSTLSADDIPTTALAAYLEAATYEQAEDPSCNLSWPLLAAIGRVESDHGRFAGAVLHQDGTSTPRIIGIALNGHGTALIPDTDHGRMDGDPVYDRAVGPMQFIPSTWAIYGVDGDQDGVANPYDIFDAAATAARYLCATGNDLGTPTGARAAVWSYNQSVSYGTMVLRLEADYAAGYGLPLPTPADAAGSEPDVSMTLPPADPGALPPSSDPLPLPLPTPAPAQSNPAPASPTPSPTNSGGQS